MGGLRGTKSLRERFRRLLQYCSHFRESDSCLLHMTLKKRRLPRVGSSLARTVDETKAKAEVVPGIVPNTFILIASGNKPYLNMTVRLSPLTYISPAGVLGDSGHRQRAGNHPPHDRRLSRGASAGRHSRHEGHRREMGRRLGEVRHQFGINRDDGCGVGRVLWRGPGFTHARSPSRSPSRRSHRRRRGGRAPGVRRQGARRERA